MATNSPQTMSNIARRRAAARGDAKREYLMRRREIANAASAVFKERGYRGTTLGHIAAQMGIDRASLYYYYSSKDELFHDIVTEAATKNLAAARRLRNEDAPAPEKLRRLLEGLMQSYADSYPVLYIVIQENLSHVARAQSDWAAKMRRINGQYERILIEIIEDGQAEGTIRTDHPAWMHAYGILGMFGWTSRWFNPQKSPASAAEIGAVFADIVLEGVAA